jgi:ABC-type branched-subunit amino acid transport system ATPase component
LESEPVAILTIDDISAGYGDVSVLNGVSADVPEGDIVCFIGPNGAGKSTLFRCIYNMIEPSQGDIRFDGDSTIGLSQEELLDRGISYVLQRNAVFEKMTVEENLRMGAFAAPSGFDVQGRIEEMYDLFPLLAERSADRAGGLSGGQQQILEFGRGLMLEPELLLLDEPTAGLAPKIIDQVFEEVENINAMGVTILMIEQNIKTGLNYADYAYVLENGQNRFDGPADTVLENPEVRAAYLGESV